jgi:predicted enzyme related to lactoylglutathione lyase
MRFSGVMIGSDNAKALGEFYSQILGEPGFQSGEWYGWNTGAQLMLGAHSDVHGQNTAPQRIMLSIEVDDVKASFATALSLGAKVVAEPYQPEADNENFWLATLEDIDGNYFQLAPGWEL